MHQSDCQRQHQPILLPKDRKQGNGGATAAILDAGISLILFNEDILCLQAANV